MSSEEEQVVMQEDSQEEEENEDEQDNEEEQQEEELEPLIFTIASHNIMYDEMNHTLQHLPDSWSSRKTIIVNSLLSNTPDIVAIQNASLQQVEDLAHLFNSSTVKYDWYGLGGAYYGPKLEDADTANADYKQYSGVFCPLFYNSAKIVPVKKGTFWCSLEPNVHGSKSWDACRPRSATYIQFADVKQPKKQFWVYNVHLDQGRFARKNSIYLLRSQIGEAIIQYQGDDQTAQPCVLVGDFNVQPNTPLYNLITLGDLGDKNNEQAFDEEDDEDLLFQSAVEAESYHFNFDNTKPDAQLDYIFMTDSVMKNKGQVLDCYRSDNRPASLHLPLFAELEL